MGQMMLEMPERRARYAQVSGRAEHYPIAYVVSRQVTTFIHLKFYTCHHSTISIFFVTSCCIVLRYCRSSEAQPSSASSESSVSRCLSNSDNVGVLLEGVV